MSIATTTLQLYQSAEAAILKGQSYRFGERELTMADLVAIQKGRREWEQRVAAELSAQAGRPQASSSLGFATVNFGCRE